MTSDATQRVRTLPLTLDAVALPCCELELLTASPSLTASLHCLACVHLVSTWCSSQEAAQGGDTHEPAAPGAPALQRLLWRLTCSG